jgi:hypothetical protein
MWWTQPERKAFCPNCGKTMKTFSARAWKMRPANVKITSPPVGVEVPSFSLVRLCVSCDVKTKKIRQFDPVFTF